MKALIPMMVIASVAMAQEASGPVEASPSPAEPAAASAAPSPEGPTKPPAPPPVSPLVPPEFHQRALSWDSARHQATLGRDHKVLSREEFFTTIERPDLVDQSASLGRRRIVLATASVITAIAGLTSGALVLANNVDLNSPACVQSTAVFNSCSDTHRTNTLIGVSLIVAGVVGAGLLASFAYWSSPDVVDDDEAQRLISRYNGDLLKRLRLNAIWLPGGGAIGLSTRF